MTVTVIILTKNEEHHLGRALESVSSIAQSVLVIDSGSTDRTVEIARAAGANVHTNAWINHATQFNWALGNLPEDTEWVFRLDADEVVTQSLAEEIQARIPGLPTSVDGVYVARRMTFLGHTIRWGGVFPIRVLRIFRHGTGRCENRWMDEHIVVEGDTVSFEGEIVDDNLNSLTWWTEKHNKYASREVVDLLNLEYGFMDHETIADLRAGRQAGVKRWIKEKVYVRLPSGWRAFGYFFYRYFIRLGFLDGKYGAAFHILQGFWYRYLVDMKRREVKSYMNTKDVDVLTAIRDVLGINIER